MPHALPDVTVPTTGDHLGKAFSLGVNGLYRLGAAYVRRTASNIPLLRRSLRTHPFDRTFGTDTGGYVPVHALQPDERRIERTNCYCGSQPSIVRQALRSLRDHERYVFVDAGCGKGRPLLIASEFPFRRIVGVEISPALARCARQNAELFKGKYPGRTAIDVVCSDVGEFEFEGSHLLLFMYHAFPRHVVQTVADKLEAAIRSTAEHVVVVYYNPVFGDVLDHSPSFVRMSAQTLPYEVEELGYGPDAQDTVVIWQSVPERFPRLPGAERPIIVTKPLNYAELG